MEGTSSSSCIDTDLFADDFYFSALCDQDELFPISDEKYAEELQLQEALFSSSTVYPTIATHSTTPELPLKKSKKEIGQCSFSKAKSVFCSICMEETLADEIFDNRNCSHAFCNHCISSYIASKIQENFIKIKCPDLKCRAELEPEFCQDIVPKQVFERWEHALCESLVLASQKFYCPYKDCSGMLVDDGGVAVTVSECPHCRRLFCAQCKVSWHVGVDCSEFKMLKKDGSVVNDMLVMELAKKKNWRRCPSCKFYVDKTQGCLHITCRCGFEFCYGCGSRWSSIHKC